MSANYVSRKLDLRQLEVKIEEDSLQLLKDLFIAMPRQNYQQLLDDCDLYDDGSEYIEAIDPVTFKITTELFSYNLEDLSLDAQKNLINYIIENNLYV